MTNVLASDVADMSKRSWPLADIIAVICLWPVKTQAVTHTKRMWVYFDTWVVSGPDKRVSDSLKSSKLSPLWSIEGNAASPVWTRESSYSASANGASEAAVRGGLSITLSFQQQTRPPGFIWPLHPWIPGSQFISRITCFRRLKRYNCIRLNVLNVVNKKRTHIPRSTIRLHTRAYRWTWTCKSRHSMEILDSASQSKWIYFCVHLNPEDQLHEREHQMCHLHNSFTAVFCG